MTAALQRIALFLLITLFVMNFLAVPTYGREMQDQTDTAEGRIAEVLPETGDRLLTRIKLTGLTVIASASILILLNYRKRV